MSNREKSDDIVGVEFNGVESAGVESAGSEWGGVGGRPTLSASLDLQFASDKNLTARKGPNPTFARGTKGFYIGLGVYVAGEILIPTGTSNGRNSWAVADGTVNHALSYDGIRWVAGIDPGDFSQVTYYAANGSEWRPDKANWSSSGIPSEFTPVEATGDPTILINAEINEPRFDHDPMTGLCKGLLIEEGRQNYLINSQDFQNWATGGGGVVSRNKELVITDPAGGFNSNRLVCTTGGNVYRDPIASVPDGTHCASLYARAIAEGINSILLEGSGCTVRVNLETGAVLQSTGTTGTALVTQASTIGTDGFCWYRISYVPTNTTSKSIYIGASAFTGTRDLYLIWGSQYELGAFPTSYIPTIPASAARSADVCSITGNAFNDLYNAPEGTLLVNAEEFRRGISYTPIFRIANSADAGINRYQIGTAGSKTGTVSPIEFYVSSNGSLSYSTSPNSATSNFKAALAYSVDNMRGALNGVIATADTAPSALIIGANTFTINSVGGYISAVRYYKKRLPDAKLQAITV